MEQNNQRNSRKRLNSLILLVAFTAVMLIVSTYAWFSTQRNVTLSGLTGTVKVAEGLQVSLDAKHWVNAINFGDFNQTSADSWTVKDTATTTYLDAGATFQQPATGIKNIVPTEYLPVSTTGETNNGIGKDIVYMYKGEYTDSAGLGTVSQVAADAAAESSAGGYFAFDLYLMNTSSGTQTHDNLQLDAVSDVGGGNEATGIQNTVRVALGAYTNTGDAMKIGQSTEPDQSAIIAGTSTSQTIRDLAIWEPNSDKHVSNIVNSTANNLKLTSTDQGTYSSLTHNATTGISKFADGHQLPTYALSADSVGKTIAKVYDWTQTDVGLVKQKTTQTTAYASADDFRAAPIDLKSVSDASGNTKLQIVANQYQKVRVYVWIEGQDPDCINYASLGQSLRLDLGLSKPESQPGS